MKKRKKKKNKDTWELPQIPKSEKELRKLIEQVISFASVSRACNKKKKYDIAYEFMTRVNEVSDVILSGMEELPPEK